MKNGRSCKYRKSCKYRRVKLLKEKHEHNVLSWTLFVCQHEAMKTKIIQKTEAVTNTYTQDYKNFKIYWIFFRDYKLYYLNFSNNKIYIYINWAIVDNIFHYCVYMCLFDPLFIQWGQSGLSFVCSLTICLDVEITFKYRLFQSGRIHMFFL